MHLNNKLHFKSANENFLDDFVNNSNFKDIRCWGYTTLVVKRVVVSLWVQGKASPLELIFGIKSKTT